MDIFGYEMFVQIYFFLFQYLPFKIMKYCVIMFLLKKMSSGKNPIAMVNSAHLYFRALVLHGAIQFERGGPQPVQFA